MEVKKKEYTREIEVARNFTPPKTKNIFIKYYILIVGFICFINQSQNDVPNFFLRVCAVLLIKNGEK